VRRKQTFVVYAGVIIQHVQIVKEMLDLILLTMELVVRFLFSLSQICVPVNISHNIQ
jgi:hypothetical protein